MSMMFYAIVMICDVALAQGACVENNSVFFERSDAVFDTIDACKEESLRHIHNDVDFSNILEDGKSYQVNINCEKGTPA